MSDKHKVSSGAGAISRQVICTREKWNRREPCKQRNRFTTVLLDAQWTDELGMAVTTRYVSLPGPRCPNLKPFSFIFFQGWHKANIPYETASARIFRSADGCIILSYYLFQIQIYLSNLVKIRYLHNYLFKHFISGKLCRLKTKIPPKTLLPTKKVSFCRR